MNFESDISQGPIGALSQKLSNLASNLREFIYDSGCDPTDPYSIKLWLDDLHYLIYQFDKCETDLERELHNIGQGDDTFLRFMQRLDLMVECESAREQKIQILWNSSHTSVQVPNLIKDVHLWERLPISGDSLLVERSVKFAPSMTTEQFLPSGIQPDNDTRSVSSYQSPNLQVGISVNELPIRNDLPSYPLPIDQNRTEIDSGSNSSHNVHTEPSTRDIGVSLLEFSGSLRKSLTQTANCRKQRCG